MRLKSIPRLFLLLTIASIPFSIRTFFYDASSYASGMFFETTAIFLNLTEVLLWITLISFLLTHFHTSFRPDWRNLKKYVLKNSSLLFLTAFLILNFVSAFFAKDATLSLLFSFKILEGVLFAWLITQRILSHREILIALILVGLFQGSLAMRQFVLQHDLGLQFLGEPNLDVSTLGAAKMNIGNEKLLRGYGTFAHPNILGAFLVILFFYLDKLKWDKIKYLILIPLFFTFSRGAFLAVFVGLLVKAFSTKNKFKKTIGALMVVGIFGGALYSFFPERFMLDSAIWARIDFIKVSWKMFLANPFGVGNGNYLFHIQDYYQNILKPWDFQPVHNLYLLVLNENGALGFLAFIGFLVGILVTLFKKKKEALPLFLAILVLGLFDHYFWDIDSGRWLFWMVIGMMFLVNEGKKKKEE